MDLTGAGNISVTSPASGTIGSIVGGSAAISKIGNGSLNLTTANTFSGGFNLSAGTARVNNNTALGAASSAVTIADSTTLATTSSTARTLTYAFSSTANAFTLGQASGGTGAGTMAGTLDLGGLTPTITVNNASDTISAVVSNGGITKAGTGTLTLSGANSFGGATDIQTGVLAVSNATGLGTTGADTTVESGAALQVSGAITIGEHLNITGTGISNAGALRKTANNATALSNGIALGTGGARINSDSNTLTISTIGAGNITGVGQPLTFGGAGNVTVSSFIKTGSGGTIVKDGAGTLTLSANNSNGTDFAAVDANSVVITINAGVLSQPGEQTGVAGTTSATGVLPAAAVPSYVLINGGTLRSTRTGVGVTFLANNKGITLGANGGSLDVSDATQTDLNIYAGVITGVGGLTKTGVGVLSVAGAATYQGATHVAGGTLRVRTNSNIFPTGTALTVDSGAIFDLNGLSQTVGSVAGAGNINLGSGTFTNGSSNAATLFSGQFVETAGGVGGKVTKQGTGSLTLTGSSLNTGLTTISNGTVLADNTSGSATGTGPVTIASAGKLGGTGTIAGAITNNGKIAPGDVGVGTLTASGNVTDGANSHWAIDLSGGTADKLAVGGNLDLSAVDALDVTGTGTGPWVIATYVGSLTGTFDTVTSGYTVDYSTAGQITLNAAAAGLPGDFNSDGKVDAGDYATWRKNDVANAALANDNGVGNQAARFTLWRANFGNPLGAGSGDGLSSAATVPEPGTLGLVAMGLVGLAARRRLEH